MRSSIPVVLLASVLALCPSCKSEAPAPPAQSSAVAPSVAEPAAAPATADTRGAVAAPSSAACPEGTWIVAGVKEQMQANLDRSGGGAMRVVESSGNTEYTFTPTGPAEGRYRMDAVGGKALGITVESSIGTQTQRTRVEVTGTVEGTYRKVGADQVAFADPTTRSIGAKASVTIAGKTIDMPAFQVPADAWRGTVRATCTADGMTIVSQDGATFYNGLRLRRR